MSKSAKKRTAGSTAKPVSTRKAPATSNKTKTAKGRASAAALSIPMAIKPRTPTDPQVGPAGRNSKQSRVLAMLQSPAGATIAAMMRATGWQQHSVRGFLAGVVRKRLNLDLISKKVDGTRVYQVASGKGDKNAMRLSKRRAA